MLRHTRIQTCMLAIAIALTSVPFAWADGWSLNPFGKSSASRADSPLYGAGPSSKSSWMPSMKMPTMPWSKPKTPPSSYQRNKKSTWQKMSSTSKRWWNKTTEMLDPYPEPKPETYTEAPKKKSSWMPAMFQSKEKKAPNTVEDFLRQEAPK